MKNNYHPIYSYFLSCFTDSSIEPQIIENEIYIQYSWKLTSLKNTQEDFILNEMNKRDKITLTISQYDNEIVSFHSSDMNFDKQDFWDNIKSLTGDEPIEFVLKITKNEQDKTISIYEFESFLIYLKSLSLIDFFSLYAKLLNPYIIFEIQETNFSPVKTGSIFFVNKNYSVGLIENTINDEIRKKKILFQKTHAFSDYEKLTLLPEDFYVASDKSDLEILFRAISQLLSFTYISDFSKLQTENICFKINGYKSISFSSNVKKVSDLLSSEADNCDIFYKIYEWIYSNNNIDERIVIARNIVSLNFESNSMTLDRFTLDAIKSNYKIFEKENIDRYINVRNEISGNLIDLQDRIQNIVSNFTEDFKKSIFTILSFYISVIIINVISSGNFVTCFTKPVIILGISFILISFIYLFISRWNLNKQKKMYEKHYFQIRNRYKDILSENELNLIFEDCDPNITESKKNYLEQQENIYSVAWFFSLMILLLSSIELYKCNIGESLLLNLINSLPF